MDHQRIFLAVLRFTAQMGSQRGQTMAEYGIMIATVAALVVLAATALGSDVSKLFSSSGGHL